MQIVIDGAGNVSAPYTLTVNPYMIIESGSSLFEYMKWCVWTWIYLFFGSLSSQWSTTWSKNSDLPLLILEHYLIYVTYNLLSIKSSVLNAY